MMMKTKDKRQSGLLGLGATGCSDAVATATRITFGACSNEMKNVCPEVYASYVQSGVCGSDGGSGGSGTGGSGTGGQQQQAGFNLSSAMPWILGFGALGVGISIYQNTQED